MRVAEDFRYHTQHVTHQSGNAWRCGSLASRCYPAGMSMFWVMLLKPFVALAFFGVVLWLARLVMRCIPAGRIRRLLATPLTDQGRARRWP